VVTLHNIEVRIAPNRRVIFQEDVCLLTIDDSLIEHHKVTSINYTQIQKVCFYSSNKENFFSWIGAFFLFLFLCFVDADSYDGEGENPNSKTASKKGIELFLLDGSQKYIALDLVDKTLIKKMLSEFDKRVK
jgi:hypothetical protein